MDENEITPGSKWFFNDGSPFPPNVERQAVVIEVRQGWVRYDLAFMKDQRALVTTFLQLYALAEPRAAA